MKRILLVMALVPVGLALAIQLVPVERTNPPVGSDLVAPAEVKTLLVHSCYDCHSNETVWPWYSYVAPASWIVSRDVKRARRHLNFSLWGDLDPRRRGKKLEAIQEEVEEEGMPLPLYLSMHPEARLTAEERARIVDWTRGDGAAPPR